MLDFADDGDSSRIQRIPRAPDGAEMLMIGSRSSLASIDMRLIDEDVYHDYGRRNPGTKLNRLCSEVVKIYEQERDMRGAQLIFSDKGTPKDKGLGFNVYDAIRDICVTQYNIPSTEIAIIHDFKSDDARRKLEDMVNNGDARIVIGSTAKLGTGVNMQKRLKAIQNIDVPWRPIDFEQRIGRVERQGNLYSDVDVFFYTTEKTLDAFIRG